MGTTYSHTMGAGRTSVPDFAWAGEAFTWLGLGVAAFSLSELSLLTPFAEQGTALFWLATGLTMGVLIRLPFHSWPGALGATFLFCVASNLNHSIPLGLSLSFALANVLEPACGAALFTFFSDRQGRHLVSQALILMLSATVASGIGATIGVGSLILNDSVTDIPRSASLWYIADLLGLLLVAPLVLAWWPRSSWSGHLKTRHFLPELGLAGVVALAAGYASFWQDLGPLASTSLLYAHFVLLVSSGLRLGARGATIMGLFVAILAVSGTLAGHGPFAHGDGDLVGQATSLQVYLLTVTFAGLLPGLSASEREKVQTSKISLEESGTGPSDAIDAIDDDAKLAHFWRDDSAAKSSDPEQSPPPNQHSTSDILDEIGDIAAGAAHDFNNILTAIQGSAQLLSFDAQEEQKELIGDILEASKAARELTSRLASMKRPERVQFETYNLNDLLSDARRFLTRLGGENLQLDYVLPSTDLKVKTDSSQLKHALFLLTLNVRRAVTSGGTLTIRAEEEKTSPSPQHINLTITCEAEDAAQQKRLRDALTGSRDQGQSTEVVQNALSASEISRRLGARIAIEGDRTSTKVTLFLRKPEIQSRPARQTSHSPDVHAGQRILVVEDGAELRAPLERLLLRKGFRPTMVASSEEALEFLQQQEFDLLLTDVMMPGMSGQQLRDEVHRISPTLPVLFMSGFGDETLGPRLQGSRPPRLLRKPFTAQELSEAVLETLAGKSPGSAALETKT